MPAINPAFEGRKHMFSGREIWSDFNKKIDELLVLISGRRVAIWGYGYSGWCAEHMLKREHRVIDLLMDSSPKMNKVKLENPNIICEMDPEAWFVILTFKPEQKAESFLEENGFKKNYNYINVREFFYENNYSRLFSYHHWLEDRYNLDIMSSSNMEYKGDNGCYSPGTLLSGGTLWEAVTADCFRQFPLPDRAV